MGILQNLNINNINSLLKFGCSISHQKYYNIKFTWYAKASCNIWNMFTMWWASFNVKNSPDYKLLNLATYY